MLGTLLGATGNYDDALLDTHKWLGWFKAISCIGLTLIKPKKEEQLNFFSRHYIKFLFGNVVLLSLAGHWVNWGRLDQWYAKQFAYFIEKMKNTTDVYGSLLDSTLVLYGSACSNTHNARNYPLILAGGADLGVKHGTYTTFNEKEERMSNLYLSMLQRLDIEKEHFSDSTGPLSAIL